MIAIADVCALRFGCRSSLSSFFLSVIFFEFCLNLVYECRYPVRRFVCICPTVPAVPVAALLGNEGCSANRAKTYLFSFASLSARVKCQCVAQLFEIWNCCTSDACRMLSEVVR